jgi:hypothetical protein
LVRYKSFSEEARTPEPADTPYYYPLLGTLVPPTTIPLVRYKSFSEYVLVFILIAKEKNKSNALLC